MSDDLTLRQGRSTALGAAIDLTRGRFAEGETPGWRLEMLTPGVVDEAQRGHLPGRRAITAPDFGFTKWHRPSWRVDEPPLRVRQLLL